MRVLEFIKSAMNKKEGFYHYHGKILKTLSKQNWKGFVKIKLLVKKMFL